MTDQDEVQSNNKGTAGAPGGLNKQLKAMEVKEGRERINPWEHRDSAMHVLTHMSDSTVLEAVEPSGYRPLRVRHLMGIA